MQREWLQGFVAPARKVTMDIPPPPPMCSFYNTCTVFLFLLLFFCGFPMLGRRRSHPTSRVETQEVVIEKACRDVVIWTAHLEKLPSCYADGDTCCFWKRYAGNTDGPFLSVGLEPADLTQHGFGIHSGGSN